MEIKVNNNTLQVQDNTTVTALLKQIGRDSKGIAVAINNEVLPKTNWEKTTFNADDSVVIIQATQGG